MRLATRPSLTARISGMPPATAASNPSIDAAAARLVEQLGPWWASSALLAVTTCLPAVQRPQDEGARRLEAAHQLDHDVTDGSASTRAASAVSGSAREVETFAGRG